MKNTRKIKSIKISDFGKFKNKTFEFHEGVNVVIGDSGAGKSTLIRALYYNIHNKPKNAEKIFKRIESGKMSVEVTDTEGNKVIHKHKTYIVNNLKPLKAFGNDIPSEVTDIFPLTNINWQRQHDGFFLLWNTPGNAAKMLNQVMGMEEQESIIKYIKEKISDEKGELKRATKNLEEVELNLKKLSSAKKFKFKIDNLIKQEKDIISQGEKIDRVNSLVSSYKALQRSDSRFLVLKRIPELNQLIEEAVNLEKLKNQINDLWEIVEELKEYEEKPAINTQKYLDEVGRLEKQYAELKQKKIDLDRIENYINRYKQIDKEEREKKEAIAFLEKSFNKELRRYKTCPLCNNKIKV